MNRKFLWVITVFVCVTILVAGLWPFRFNPRNKAKWLDHEDGVWFYGNGIVHSEDGIALGDRMTIEMWLRPGHNPEGDTSRILTFYDGDNEDFIIEQWKSILIARNKSRGTDGLEVQRVVGAEYVSPANNARFVTITSGPEESGIYLDGRLAERTPSRFAQDPGRARYLILGNSPTGKQPWRGDLLGLALYNRTLASDEVSQSFTAWKEKGRPAFPVKEGPVSLYLFDERAGDLAHNRLGPRHQLELPSRFQPPKRVVLAPPWVDFKLNRSHLSDVAVNLAGFVPFGFFVAALLLETSPLSRKKAYLLTVLLGFAVSLFIELSQVCLSERSSQLSDVICNTLGTAVGTFLLNKLDL